MLNPASLESTVNRYLASAAGSGTAIFDARVGQELSTWLNIVTTEVIGPETLLLLVGALLAYLVWRPPMPRFTLLVGLYLGLLAAYALLVSLREPRHLIPAIPMLALLIALLIDWSRLVAWLRSRRFVRNHPRGRWQRKHRSPESGASWLAIAMLASNSRSSEACDIMLPCQLKYGSLFSS